MGADPQVVKRYARLKQQQWIGGLLLTSVVAATWWPFLQMSRRPPANTTQLVLACVAFGVGLVLMVVGFVWGWLRWKCPRCRHSLGDGSPSFCPHCGEALTVEASAMPAAARYVTSFRLLRTRHAVGLLIPIAGVPGAVGCDSVGAAVHEMRRPAASGDDA